MVKFNVVALLAIAFGAASVAGASGRNFKLQQRGAELAELIEARELAYSEYEARQLQLLQRAQELEDRGYDIEEILLFQRYNFITQKFKDEILEWLKQANGAAQFGAGIWAPMHSGGTSIVPHCRPYGMKKTVEKEGPKKGNKKTKVKVDEYRVKMDCAPNSKKPDSKTEVVSDFVMSSGNSPHPAPETAKMYAELTKRVKALQVG